MIPETPAAVIAQQTRVATRNSNPAARDAARWSNPAVTEPARDSHGQMVWPGAILAHRENLAGVADSEWAGSGLLVVEMIADQTSIDAGLVLVSFENGPAAARRWVAARDCQLFDPRRPSHHGFLPEID